MDVLEQQRFADQSVRARRDEGAVDVHDTGDLFFRDPRDDRVEVGRCPEPQRIQIPGPGIAFARGCVIARLIGILGCVICGPRGAGSIALHAGEDRERHLVTLVARQRADQHGHPARRYRSRSRPTFDSNC